MNILLIDPPSLAGESSESGQTKLPTPNMGLLYMATYLKSRVDAHVSVLDMVANSTSFDSTSDIMKKYRPAIIGISAKTFNILAAYKLSHIIKKMSPNTVVIIGGAHPTALPEYTLNECSDIDAVVLREGEDTFLDVVKRMKDGYNSKSDDTFADIPGIVYRNKDGEVLHNGGRGLITDLDSLPFPDMSLIDYKRYRRVYNPTKYRFQLRFRTLTRSIYVFFKIAKK